MAGNAAVVRYVADMNRTLQRSCEQTGSARKASLLKQFGVEEIPLEWDPDKFPASRAGTVFDGTSSITEGSRREAVVAEAVLKDPVRPTTLGSGDFVEDGGRGDHWDVKGFLSYPKTPKKMAATNKIFNANRAVEQMGKAMTKGDTKVNIIVDTEFLETGDCAELKAAIKAANLPGRVIFYPDRG